MLRLIVRQALSTIFHRNLTLALPTTHRRVRLAVVPLLLASVLGSGLLLQHRQHAGAAPAQVADPSRAQVILDWYADRTRGDDTAAAALFADNAVFIGAATAGFCTTQMPCYDRASELQNLQTVAAASPNPCYTVTNIQVSGSIVTGRLEGRNDAVRGRGIERTVVAFLADVRDGKIQAYFQRFDLADRQTALNLAILAGTAQPGTPIPTPDPVCG